MQVGAARVGGTYLCVWDEVVVYVLSTPHAIVVLSSLLQMLLSFFSLFAVADRGVPL